MTINEALEAMRDYASSHVTYWVGFPWSDIAAAAWLYVAVISTGACVSRWRHTVMERIAMAAVALGAFSRAFTIFGRQEVAWDGAWLALTCAFYATVLTWKYLFIIPRRPDYTPPDDMPKY